MKKYILTSAVFLFACCSIQAQNKISASAGYGYYLSNSENNILSKGDEKRYKSYFHFGLAYQTDDVFGLNLMLEYSYHRMMKEGAFEFFSGTPANMVADASLINHNIDLAYIGIISPYFSWGLGPSFLITNRIIEIDNPDAEAITLLLYDKLASSGLGANAFIDFSVPFSETENYFFFSSEIKFRYTHSIWFDEGIRNLDNYKQEFLVFTLSAGIGYSF